jgi:hypothetical protein
MIIAKAFDSSSSESECEPESVDSDCEGNYGCDRDETLAGLNELVKQRLSGRGEKALEWHAPYVITDAVGQSQCAHDAMLPGSVESVTVP